MPQRRRPEVHAGPRRKLAWRHAAALAALAALAVVPAAGATVVASPSGVVQLGIEPWGTLGWSPSAAGPDGPGFAWRVPGVADAVGSPLTGAANSWGVCYTLQSTPASTGCACVIQGLGDCDGRENPFTQASTTTGSSAGRAWVHQSHQVGDLKVEHEWRAGASAATEELVEAEVRVTNLHTSMAVDRIAYRRSIAVAGEAPRITLGAANGQTPPSAVWSSDFGLATGNPELPYATSIVPGSGANCTQGPGRLSLGSPFASRSAQGCAPGATFQADLGRLEAGETRIFSMLFGRAPSLAAAQTLMAPAPAGLGPTLFMVAETPVVLTWSLHGLRGPTAGFDARPASPDATVLCAGSPAALLQMSTVGDWPVAASVWDFGDGSAAGYPFIGNTRHTFTSAGDHTVLLRVVDANGWMAEAARTVRVTDCSNGMPAAPVVPGQVALDTDGDGVPDASDPCPQVTSQAPPCAPPAEPAPAAGTSSPTSLPASRALPKPHDRDADGAGDRSDNCPMVPNVSQADLDLDGVGDACDEDMDGDGVVEAAADARVLLDNCPAMANPDQSDVDRDAIGDACQAVPVLQAAEPPAAPAARLPADDNARAVGTFLAGLAGIGLLAAGWAGVRKWAGRGWPIPLFSRLRESDVLEHPVRREIMQRVEAEPGMHCQAIVRKLDRHRGLVEHHLQVLVRNGHIKEVKTAGYLCYYPATLHDRKAMEAGSMIRSGLAREVLQAIVRNPGTTIPNIAKLVGAEYGAVSYHVKRFESAGLVELHGTNGHTQAMPQALALRALGLTGAAATTNPDDMLVKA